MREIIKEKLKEIEEKEGVGKNFEEYKEGMYRPLWKQKAKKR